MDILEILLSWLRERNILPAVDSCGVTPGQTGLFPLGMEEKQRKTDILGQGKRVVRYSFLLKKS